MPPCCERDRSNLGRQHEHCVIEHRQQFILACGKPVPAGLTLAFGTVPAAAGIVGHADRPQERQPSTGRPVRRSGRARSRSSHAARCGRDSRHEPVDMLRHGGGRYPPPSVSPTWRNRSAWRHLDVQPVDRACRASDEAVRDLSVARRRTDCCGRAEPGWCGCRCVLKMRGEAVPERVDRHPLVDAGGRTRRTTSPI